jgi:hypothetical protein
VPFKKVVVNSLSGKVDLNLFTVTLDKVQLDGKLTGYILANGEEIATAVLIIDKTTASGTVAQSGKKEFDINMLHVTVSKVSGSVTFDLTAWTCNVDSFSGQFGTILRAQGKDLAKADVTVLKSGKGSISMSLEKDPSFTTRQFTAKLTQLNVKASVDIFGPKAFSLASTSYSANAAGNVKLKAPFKDTKIDLSIGYDDEAKVSVEVNSTAITFKIDPGEVTLEPSAGEKKINLAVDVDATNFELKKFSMSGAIKVGFPAGETKLDIKALEMANGGLTTFDASGVLKLKGVHFEVPKAVYQAADSGAQFEVSARLAVKKGGADAFTGSGAVVYKVGEGLKSIVLAASVPYKPVSASGSVKWSNAGGVDKFAGELNAKVTGLGEASLVIELGEGTSANSDHWVFVYCSVVVNSNTGLALGPTGLKLTGGSLILGYNEQVKYAKVEGAVPVTPAGQRGDLTHKEKEGDLALGAAVTISDVANFATVEGGFLITMADSADFTVSLTGRAWFGPPTNNIQGVARGSGIAMWDSSSSEVSAAMTGCIYLPRDTGKYLKVDCGVSANIGKVFSPTGGYKQGPASNYEFGWKASGNASGSVFNEKIPLPTCNWNINYKGNGSAAATVNWTYAGSVSNENAPWEAGNVTVKFNVNGNFYASGGSDLVLENWSVKNAQITVKSYALLEGHFSVEADLYFWTVGGDVNGGIAVASQAAPASFTVKYDGTADTLSVSGNASVGVWGPFGGSAQNPFISKQLALSF